MPEFDRVSPLTLSLARYLTCKTADDELRDKPSDEGWLKNNANVTVNVETNVRSPFSSLRVADGAA